MTLQAYLASSSEEEEEGGQDAAALRKRYRSLLLANTNGDEARTGGPKGRAWGSGDPNSEEDNDADDDAAEADGDQGEVRLLSLPDADIAAKSAASNCITTITRRRGSVSSIKA